MILKVDEIDRRIVIELDPSHMWLKKSDDDWKGEYMLCHRIDMSYKGKDDQEGAPIVYLSSSDAEKVRSLVGEIT